MYPNTEELPAPRITGQLLHVDEHRDVAIYMRNGVVKVAEFRKDHGQLVDAAAWFRNCVGAGLSHPARACARNAADPISPEVALRIEALHAGSEWKTRIEATRDASLPAVLRVVKTIGRSIRKWRHSQRPPEPPRALLEHRAR
jgi:hypothetical protein